MSKPLSVHWLAPATMFGALVAGIIFAAGHHVFYQSLNATPASENTLSLFGSTTSTQEANTAIGTALAFLVKASLVLSISVAFTQVFWRTSRARSTAQPPSLGQLDSVFSAIDNILTMFDLKIWWRYPLLLLLALTACVVHFKLIPIASIITPATLSIQTARVLPAPVLSQKVPNVDFRNTKFLANVEWNVDAYENDESILSYSNNGPSQAVIEVRDAVMAQRSILPMSPPHPNASWHLNFPGPSLRCTQINAPKLAQVQDNIQEYIKGCELTQYGFLAWLPIFETYLRHTNDMPFRARNGNASLEFEVGKRFAKHLHGPLSMYLALMPNVFNSNKIEENCQNISRADTVARIGDNMLQCHVYQSTYEVVFEFIEGVQNINIVVADDNLEVPITSVDLINGTKSDDTYCFNNDYEYIVPVCLNRNDDTFRNLTYHAIWDAFTENVLGFIGVKVVAASGKFQDRQVEVGSKILDTALSEAVDFAFLNSALPVDDSLQADLFNSGGLPTWLQGLVTDISETSQLSLGDAMEKMFQNLTVSFMSSSALQPNYSSISAPPPANVTLHKYHNVYAYSMWKLWVAYGIAILLTTLTAIVGLIAILLNGATYSNNFSTIFRVARGAHLSPAEIHDEDLDGKDPLPKYLSKAKILVNWHDGGDTTVYKRLTPTSSPVNGRDQTMTLNALDLQLPLRLNTRRTL